MDIASSLSDDDCAALAARLSPWLSGPGPSEFDKTERLRIASEERIAEKEIEAAETVAVAEAEARIVEASAEVAVAEVEAAAVVEAVEMAVEPVTEEIIEEAAEEAAEETVEALTEDFVTEDEAVTLEDIGAAESEDIEPPDVAPARTHFMHRPLRLRRSG